MIRSFVTIALFLAACSKGATDHPASVTDDMVDAADKYCSALEKLGADLDHAGTDCKQATEVMVAASADNKDLVAQLRVMKAKTGGDPAAKDWFEKTYSARLESAFRRIKLADKCDSDPDFKAAANANEILPRKHRASP